MENIKFEITEEDIKEYLKTYKNDYKYCEAMFVKYLKENNTRLTTELVQILMSKNNHYMVNKTEIKLGRVSPEFNVKPVVFRSLDIKPVIPRRLDITGICHILIPTLKYYGQNNIHVNYLYERLDNISTELLYLRNRPIEEVIESTIDNYRICGKVETSNMVINIKMGREHCRHELLTYQKFYGERPVKKIRKIIREG